MRNRVIKLLLKKELLDVFRDRKAIIMLVLVPLLIYPLIFFGSFAVMTMIQSNIEQGEYKVLLSVDDDGALERQIAKYNEDKKSEDKGSEDKKTDVDKASSGDQSAENSSSSTEEEKSHIIMVSISDYVKNGEYKPC